MIYKKFQDISLSRLGMGNMRLPLLPGGKDRDIDYAKAQEIIDYGMANGINYYDTAYVYHSGESEKFLGQALKKYDRGSFYVATKYFCMANPDYKATFEEQLSRLQMDYIDFYLIHSVTDSSIDTYLGNGCIDYFLEQKKLGKIRYLGFSSHADPKNLERFASHHAWDFAQIQLNYFDWNYSTTREEYDILKKHNIPIMVMESIRGGRLARLTPEAEAILKKAHPEWSIPSWALRWIMRLDQVQLALSGMSALDQIQDNIATIADGHALTDEEEELLFKACDMFHTQVRVPCTACRYCCDGCPMQINIPEVLKVYNQYKLDGPYALEALASIDSEGKPEDCVACGSCTGHCPQSIDVPAIMEELTRALSK